MKDLCIVSDFDGTITKKDGLYSFISTYARDNWEEIEQMWATGKIDSKTCLVKEFELVPNLSEKLINDFIQTIEIDEYFIEFFNCLKRRNIDFYIVSDGIDYFIKKILEKFKLNNLNIISNHGEFKSGKFEITFPNDSKKCTKNSGTCKCNVISKLKKKYKQTVYIGDGVSDYCVADKANILYAKSRLFEYCQKNKLPCIQYKTFNDINLF